MLEIDEDVSRKITKMSLVIWVILFLLSPVQPLLCATLMGLAALGPILLGPNALRVLGLLAFAVAGYMFWPQYQETKKIPARNDVRIALSHAENMKGIVAQYVQKNRRLPGDDVPQATSSDDKADYEVLPGGVVRVQLKFSPLSGQSVRWEPALSGVVTPAADPLPAVGPAPVAPAAPAPGGSGAPLPTFGTAPAAEAAKAPEPPPAPAAKLPVPTITWTCISDDIAQSYLPVQCRNRENLRKARSGK